MSHFFVNLAIAVFWVMVFAVYLVSIVWAANDARARGKPALLVALLVAFLFWPISLAVWIALRPEKPS